MVCPSKACCCNNLEVQKLPCLKHLLSWTLILISIQIQFQYSQLFHLTVLYSTGGRSGQKMKMLVLKARIQGDHRTIRAVLFFCAAIRAVFFCDSNKRLGTAW